MKEINENSAQTITLLNILLAEQFTVMLKVWQFHWNVQGKSFGSYHADMKTLYEAAYNRVDEVAERIRALNGTPLSSMENMLETTRIEEVPTQNASSITAAQMWATIRDDWGKIIMEIKNIHAKIGESDLGTKSFLEGMVEDMEKEHWMLLARTQTEE